MGVSLFLTATVGWITIKTQLLFLKNFPHFFDPVNYLYHNAVLSLRLAEENRFSLALSEWLANGRHPLRTVPLILFSPRLLTHPLGHLATSLPVFSIFLALLGLTIYSRTKNMIYAIGSISIFCALPGIYDLRYGLGAYWLDVTAALLMGSAVLCIINASEAKSIKWLLGFSIFASLTVLSRYSAAGYLAFTCLPIFIYCLLIRWQNEKNFFKGVLLPLGGMSLIIAVLAGYYLIAHLKENIRYYSFFGYGLRNGDIALAVKFMIPLVYSFFSRPLIILLTAAAIIHFVGFYRRGAKGREGLLVSLWLACAVILFQIAVLRVHSNKIQFIYAIIPLFVSLISPTVIRQTAFSRRCLTWLGVLFMAASVLFGGRTVFRRYQQANFPSYEYQEQKKLDIALAEALAQERRGIVWNAYFDEYSEIPSMESFYRFKKLPLPAGPQFFTIHRVYWERFYPGLTPEQVSRRVYENTQKWVHVAVVFEDPSSAEKQFDNGYSREVAKYVAETIARDPNWKKIFTLQSSRYGPLTAYRNLFALKDAYKKAFASSLPNSQKEILEA